MCSFRNWNVAPLIPPVDHTSPPTRPVEKKPASLPWRGLGSGRAPEGHEPLGQALTSSESTAVVESKYVPPFASPPRAYSVLPEAASPSSARPDVKVGPSDQVPVAMSSRIVTPTFAVGL